MHLETPVLANVSSVALLGLCLMGCTHTEPVPASDSPMSALETIYARTHRRFERAVYAKPDERTDGTFPHKLAPLLLMETSPHVTRRPALVSLKMTNGLPGIDDSASAVYWHVDGIRIQGRTHPRFSYWWYLRFGTRTGNDSLHCRGVRLTLDSNGHPVVWETLSAPDQPAILFASHALESAAQREFGGPLPGRRHALERGSNQPPSAIVARILDDGPVAMGPMVYLDTANGDIATVLCRCMPPQVGQLESTLTYRLVQAEEIRAAFETPSLPASDAVARWLRSDPPELEMLLRLPSPLSPEQIPAKKD